MPSTLMDHINAGQHLLIDGATGTELERRGVPMHDKAWCGRTPLTHGEVLREVHLDYIRAGAQVITSDTFGSAKHVLEDSGLGDEFVAINQAAIEIARQAADEAPVDHPLWVGGSVCTSFVAGNDMAALDPARARLGFREQIAILVDGGADLLMLEMVFAHLDRVGIEITVDAVEAAAATGLPVWIGMSTKLAKEGNDVLLFGSSDPYDLRPDEPDTTVPFDERVLPAFRAGAALVGIMHSDVTACSPSLEILRTLWDGPIAAYPHSGHWENPYWNFASVMPPEAYLKEARGWVERGATVIGGCCGIGPAHIETLHRQLLGGAYVG